MDVEVCIESIEEAKLAAKYKAKRVELCSGLDLGGITPSANLIETIVEFAPEVHVLVRPRGGDFCYNSEEINLIKRDIKLAKKLGAFGVVIGVLNRSNEFDFDLNKELVEFAKSNNLEVTFHRAFDLVPNPENTIYQLIELGIDRLLTSGQQRSAVEGVELIRKLSMIAKDKIQIMAGGGVNQNNIQSLLESCVDAVHFSSRKKVKEMELNMGSQYIPDEEKIAAIMNMIN